MIIFWVPVPVEKAKEIAKQLLEEKLCACVNILDSWSVYWWEGKVEEGGERVMVIKTADSLEQKLRGRIKELHPYELPAIIKMRAEGDAQYEEWVKRVCIPE